MPPEEFISYVESRMPAVIRAARGLGSDESVADDLARELLVTIASRWRYLCRVDAKSGVAVGSAADRLLRRQFRIASRELDGGRRTREALALDPVPWPTQRFTVPTSALTPADEAGLLWERASRIARRRLLIAGGVGVLGLAFFLGRPKSDEPEQLGPTIDPGEIRPSRLPAGIDVLPRMIDQTRLPVRAVGIPPSIDLRPEAAAGQVGDRASGPALAVLQDFTGGPVLILGSDGMVRSFDTSHSVDSTAVVSPGGRHAAFLTGTRIDLLDVVTGTVRGLPSGGSGSPPVWLDPHHLMTGSVGGAMITDVRTGAAVRVAAEIEDAAVPQGLGAAAPGSDFSRRVAVLLSAGEPLTAPARVRHYGPGFRGPVEVTVSGDLGGWIGRWRGVGFAYGGASGLIVRRCQIANNLPEGQGEVTAGLAVLRARTGVVLRLLLDTNLTGSTRIEPLGWLDADTVLLTTGNAIVNVLLAWRVDRGALELVGMTNRGARIAVADLSFPG